MSLHFASLNSGSNGNCYYIGNSNEAILVDVGINCKEIEKRMLRLKLDLTKIKAIFISHEHSDHILGCAVLAHKYNIPVYISAGSLNKSDFGLKRISTHQIFHEVEVCIGDLKIIPYSKIHDAADPLSFTIQFNNYTVGVITDIGIACDNVKKHFNLCDAVFLESNYDKDMLENGRYPAHLKRRITGGQGHISNAQAHELFLNHRSKNLRYLILSHLSKENNEPNLVLELFNSTNHTTEIIAASRYEESKVYVLGNDIKNKKTEAVQANVQMSLF